MPAVAASATVAAATIAAVVVVLVVVVDPAATTTLPTLPTLLGTRVVVRQLVIIVATPAPARLASGTATMSSRLACGIPPVSTA